MRYRCTGSIHGPIGDCLRPIAGAICCYGYLDRDQGVAMRESLDGPVFLVIPTCKVHKSSVIDWAEHCWGAVADAFFVPPQGIPLVLRKVEPVERVVVAPDPMDAVRIVV
jgi:hypothetical protein